jgi:hypothetical protein
MTVHPVLLRSIAALLLLLSVLAGSRIASAADAPDFTLLDEQGQAVKLHYHRLADAIVLMSHRNDSEVAGPAARIAAAAIAGLPDRQIPFFLINADAGQTRSAVLDAKREQSLSVPVLIDDTGLVSQTLAFTYTGEVLVVNPRTWEIVYRGPVSETLEESGENFVALALDAVLNDEVLPLPVREPAAGLAIDVIAAPAPAAIANYAQDIAPLLQEKCANCHRPGGIGPWAMTSHQMIQGFSPMIREVVLTKRMPPWHADPQVNRFKHDMSLSIAEAQRLVHWIDAGAPRGEGDDPLLSVVQPAVEWELGEPDLIVDLPAYSVPATGSLDYQILTVDNPLDHDVWVRAVQIVPSDRQVLHHAIATFGKKDEPIGIDLGTPIGDALLQSQLMTFVPGNEVYEYPEGTGVLVPAGATFFSQMHYTTYGRETVDQTRIGLYFAEEPPEFTLQHYAILNVDIEIAPGEGRDEEKAYYQFQKDVIVYSLFPHAHYRGRSSTFSVVYPDGREELVLSVPNYDFNWQRYFQLEEPLEVPAGSRLIHTMVYDNSPSNLSNPDAEAQVSFGEQTWEEMLYGGVSFRYANKADDVREINKQEYVTSLSMGFMDKNLDGKIELNEMPERARQRLAMAFLVMDKDKTGGLEFTEFHQMMNTQRQRPGPGAGQGQGQQ